ncbi:MAG TPA: hypothetical protein VMV04_19665 [Thermodesulfobacteriota bacterium]|nr:hypothetical protein [Thermodesulfobacteriota bacterium]
MRTLIWSVLIGLVLIVGINVEEAAAQSASDIKVSLALAGNRPEAQNRFVYLTGDQVEVVLSFQNTGGEVITTKGFSAKPFHLFLVFTGPDGRGIIAKEFEQGPPGNDPPPPPVIPVEVETGRVELLQVEPVEKVNAGWALTVTLPNAHAYYTLSSPGNYSVKAVIPMRTYLGIDHTIDNVDYSRIDQYKWKDALQSNTETFILLADADGDTYYFPEGWPPGAPADCDDNNPNDVPVTTLTSPANGATNVSTTPTLSWNKVSCAINYRLQIANDSSFQSMVLDQNGITDTSYQVLSGLLSNSKTYYWRVNANNAGGTNAWSLFWSFTTGVAAPSAPTLVSPANNATGVSTTPTLSWNASSGATSYGLQVSTSQTNWTGSNLKVNQSGITGTSQAVRGLANNTVYYWRVNATGAGGTSPWSSVWTFTTLKGYLLVVTKIGFGSITASPGTLDWDLGGIIGSATYDANTTVTLTATPNTNSAFHDWYAFCLGPGGCSVNINGSQCTLNLCGPCFAVATFMLKTYTITATAGTGGSISPSGAVKVTYGANQTFTIKSNTGYQIADVKVDGVSKGAISTYTFKNVTANHTISAIFKRK